MVSTFTNNSIFICTKQRKVPELIFFLLISTPYFLDTLFLLTVTLNYLLLTILFLFLLMIPIESYCTATLHDFVKINIFLHFFFIMFFFHGIC